MGEEFKSSLDNFGYARLTQREYIEYLASQPGWVKTPLGNVVPRSVFEADGFKDSVPEIDEAATVVVLVGRSST